MKPVLDWMRSGMICIKKPCRVALLSIPVLVCLLLAGCSGTEAGPASSINLKMPTHAIVHQLDLSAQQALRDLTGDFSVRQSGADTGIMLMPSERVEIFTTGTAGIRAVGEQLGPGGIPGCRKQTMPEPSLPCYSVIYSIGINGVAGEVGNHVGFNASSIGNLFLGVNDPNVANNAGAYHITVLVLPPGTFSGLWSKPNDGFDVQGTTMTLSADVFAQDASIARVQFTMYVPGQSPIPICDATHDGDDSWSCDWDMTVNGTYLHNGPIRVGFTINGTAQNGTALAAIVNPDGLRAGTLTYVESQPTSNYAGYAATDLNNNSPISFQKVSGSWIVPVANCAPGENSAAAIWVGMSSDATDKSLLAQLGTDSDCSSGTPIYYMWWEAFPAPSMPLNNLPLQPGDSVTASVSFQNGVFHLTIDVPSEGVHFTTTHAGKVSDTSYAECIVEAPATVDPATSQFHILPLTDFGQVSVTCQINAGEPIADGPQDVIYQMQTDAGVPKAITSSLERDGATFTVQWNHS
jgi:hypothetical protein